MGRIMISEYGLPQYLWDEAISILCFISNRVYFCKNISKTSFGIYFSRKPNVLYFRVFGCKYFILNTKNTLGKFDAKAFEAILLVILTLVRLIESSINLFLLLKNLYTVSYTHLTLPTIYSV